MSDKRQRSPPKNDKETAKKQRSNRSPPKKIMKLRITLNSIADVNQAISYLQTHDIPDIELIITPRTLGINVIMYTLSQFLQKYTPARDVSIELQGDPRVMADPDYSSGNVLWFKYFIIGVHQLHLTTLTFNNVLMPGHQKKLSLAMQHNHITAHTLKVVNTVTGPWARIFNVRADVLINGLIGNTYVKKLVMYDRTMYRGNGGQGHVPFAQNLSDALQKNSTVTEIIMEGPIKLYIPQEERELIIQSILKNTVIRVISVGDVSADPRVSTYISTLSHNTQLQSMTLGQRLWRMISQEEKDKFPAHFENKYK